MPNEEALGPRKTMFVLVIVVGCFAVLWPRILSPLIMGTSKEQLKPNQFDRDAGCCEVIFETEVAILELLNEVCSSVVQADGKLSPYAAAECRRAVNETCGVDIQAFLKRSDNVGKTTKMLLDTMKASNSSCLKEHFGVPIWSISIHPALNSWMQQDTLKQERPISRGAGAGPHPALRERGRAIPPGAPPSPTPRPAPLPAHVRVRSPLLGYFELDIKPPPIPGMRPPLGSPGGPVTAPKSSMGFVMPIYTICIIVFFVYTLSKILFKRTGSTTYDQVSPDPQFRRRVFRDDSRSSPDKLVVTAISGLVAEVQQQMEASYASNQQRQELQDDQARPYTNGTIIHSGPVQIVASEYREPLVKQGSIGEEKEPKELSTEPKELSPEPKELSPDLKEVDSEVDKEISPESKELTPELIDLTPEPKELSPEPKELSPEPKELTPEPKEPTPEQTSPEPALESNELPESKELPKPKEPEPNEIQLEEEPTPIVAKSEESLEKQREEANNTESVEELRKFTDNIQTLKDSVILLTENLLNDEKERTAETEEKKSTPELLEEALKEDSPVTEDEVEDGEHDNGSVKVVGMELTTHAADGGAWPRAQGPPLTAPPQKAPHEAEQVQSIFLETEIPQQSRVLVADFDSAGKPAAKHDMVVSGKMTLSLIQDAPRDTPERDLESTLDDFTTASAVTQPAAEKEDNLSDDEEIEEEIEIEEIEEEVEVEEIEEDEEPKEPQRKQ